jgi:hypothetical protein
MRKIHTYFYVRNTTPIGYSNLIDEELEFYCKANDLNLNLNEYHFELRVALTKNKLAQYSNLSFEEFDLKDYSEQVVVFKKIIENIDQNFYKTILEKFCAKTTEFKNVFLVEMKYFKNFISEFIDFPYVDWDSISSNKYYDWDVECLTIGKHILNWKELMVNEKTLNLIKSKDFPQELKSLLPKIDEMNDFQESDENWKSVFVIKEYSGSLHDYFRLESIVKKEVKKNIPNIREIKWLSSYSTPFDIMNREKFKFDISDYDYILAFDIDTDRDGTNSNMAKKIALEQNLTIFYTLDELKENASC